jgi:hypothetical protein
MKGMKWIEKKCKSAKNKLSEMKTPFTEEYRSKEGEKLEKGSCDPIAWLLSLITAAAALAATAAATAAAIAAGWLAYETSEEDNYYYY